MLLEPHLNYLSARSPTSQQDQFVCLKNPSSCRPSKPSATMKSPTRSPMRSSARPHSKAPTKTSSKRPSASPSSAYSVCTNEMLFQYNCSNKQPHITLANDVTTIPEKALCIPDSLFYSLPLGDNLCRIKDTYTHNTLLLHINYTIQY
jgi:hypothetical protein